MIKSFFYQVMLNVWDYLQRFRLSAVRNNAIVHVIDIDNTLTIYRGDGKIDHINPDARHNMIQYVRDLIVRNHKVIFLSARDFRLWNPTIQWLSKQNVLVSKKDVFLLPNASAKIDYLNKLIEQNIEVNYIDDLSYNHEKGQVKLYEEVLSLINKMPLTYKGIDFIESI